MANQKQQKIIVTAPLLMEAAAMLKAAKALDLPPSEDRQPDLQYLTAIFVSSGMNKNGAVFLGSELVKARQTIPNKAVDIEHDEQTIIGHITNSVFLDRSGDTFDAETASRELSVAQMDEKEMDIAISATIHKTRFPEIASEILDGQWMVSMEAFYSDFDIKVGDLIIPRSQAEELGYDDLVGTVVQLRDGKTEMGHHLVGRVLRNILFAGVGIVKNPANERSIILEAAALDKFVESNKEHAKIMNVADIRTLEGKKEDVANRNIPLSENKEELLEDIKKIIVDEIGKITLSGPDKKVNKEGAGIDLNHISPGTCVNFRKYVAAVPGPDSDPLDDPATDLTQFPLTPQTDTDAYPPGTKIVRENYCNLFDLDCSARPGDATLPECWRNVFARTVRDEIINHEELLKRKRISEGLVELQRVLESAKKFSI